jgi:hypothetical protein
LVEGRRKDLELLSYFYPPLSSEGPQTKEETDARIDEVVRDGALYALFPDNFEGQRSRLEEAGYRLVPVEEGTLYRVVPAKT